MPHRHPVLLTRRLPPAAMALLESRVALTCNAHERDLTREELLGLVRGQHGVISMLTDRLDAEVFDAAPNLKVVSNYAVGYNNIDVAAARARGIVVTNTPGVLTDATADLTWALILGIARRVGEGERIVRSGTWTGWAPTQLLGAELRGGGLGSSAWGGSAGPWRFEPRASACAWSTRRAVRHPTPSRTGKPSR